MLFIIRYKISDFGCAGYPAGSWPAFRRVLIELRQGGAGDLPFIIVQVAAEGLVAVQFQMRHDKIGIAHAEIRAGGTSFTLVVAGAHNRRRGYVVGRILSRTVQTEYSDGGGVGA